MSEKLTAWITGSKGYLGTELMKRLETLDYNVVGTDMDVTVCDVDRLQAFATASQPDVVINCAGIPRNATGLSNRIKAYETNALGARNVSVAANGVGAKMVQISTDDVFPSRLHDPANEFDVPNPESPYGKSKHAGEVMVRDIAENHLIVRTSWLYATSGGILKDILDALEAGKSYKARTDQLACPTPISFYTAILDKAIRADAKGVLHVSTKGCVSRYDFAKLAVQTMGRDPGATLEPTTDLVTAEKIELESLMLAMIGSETPTWEDALKDYLKEAGLAK